MVNVSQLKSEVRIIFVVATWVLWTFTEVLSRTTTVSPLLMVVEEHSLLSYGEVNFTTANATKDSYSQFLKVLRANLANNGGESHTIPVLRERSTVPDTERFVLVELSNWQDTITLAVDVIDAYVVAYRAGSRSYFFRDAPRPAADNLFTDTQQQTLAYNGSYGQLQSWAAANRENISLGISELDRAITTLRWYNRERERARSFIVCIQMVSEAARYRYIEQLVRRSITSSEYETFDPDGAVISFENNWQDLSDAIQGSNQGVFESAVVLQRPDYSQLIVSSLTRAIIANLGLMLFYCRDNQFSPLLISTVVDMADDSDICVVPEPTVLIRGRNGLCVDVRDGKYNDGNPIQLWRCKEQLDVNQLWTLKTDGTIRSNGRCLTTYGYSPGNYVMIYDCDSAVPDATRWQVWDNGTIANPKSGLVLSANSGDSGTTLTVEQNVYASRQGWLAGNYSEPFVTSIVGFNDLCMEANGDNMWLLECVSSKAEQKWAMYPDGSLRPQQNRNKCLTSAEHSIGARIVLLGCSPGWARQRWVFRNDGTIYSLSDDMVMDVKRSDPSLHQVILWPATGNPNQKWFPLP